MQNGKLYLSNVGMIKLRGRARTEGTPKTLEIIHRNGCWYGSVSVECKPKRASGQKEVGFDWGLENFLTFDDGSVIENPRLLKKSQVRIKFLQRKVSKKKRGGKNRKKCVRLLAKAHEKVANQRKNFQHQESKKLVQESNLIVTEKLKVANMTRSSKGTEEKPGKRVKQKSGLNRNILDGAPAAFLQMVQYKAEEAGIAYIEVPTRQIAPSQTCPGCGEKKKKLLSERIHACTCGITMPRDQAAALVCLNYAREVGNQPTGRHPH